MQANYWDTRQRPFPVVSPRAGGAAGTMPAATFPPNGYGLHDMTGNAWQWVADWYRADYFAMQARLGRKPIDDPQGPDVHLPTDPIDSGPTPPPGIGAYLTVALIGLAAAGVFWLGWRIDVPVLDWLLMIVGGFFVSVVVFLLGIFMFGPKEDAR